MITDEHQQENLTDRQEKLLELVVRHYIQHGNPIGSKSLVDALGVSSATIRNEMSYLERTGFLASPHASAGRMPTEYGYRYFVQRLLGNSDLISHERRMIAHQFHQAPLDLDQWMRLAAAVLARTTLGVSLVTAPRSHIHHFKHLELIETQGRLVLMVLVLNNGNVRQRMLALNEPVNQEQLSEIAARITRRSVSMSAAQIQQQQHNLPPLEQEVMALVAALMQEADNPQPQIVYHDGLTALLDSFYEHESEGAQQALRVIEEQTTLESLLTEAVDPQVGSVRVVIAGEGRWEEINLLSIVLGRYGVEGHATGTLGIVGPTHMPYRRVIGTVRYVADLMSGLLLDLYGEGSASERTS